MSPESQLPHDNGSDLEAPEFVFQKPVIAPLPPGTEILIDDEMRAIYEQTLAEWHAIEDGEEDGVMKRNDGDLFVGERGPGPEIRVGPSRDED